jgi:ATP-dependent Clp protease, protease subunit
MAKEDNDDVLGGHSDSLNNSGIYVFMGEVTEDSVKPVIEWILFENFVTPNKKKELLLMICSEGGELQTAFALIDVMQSSHIPIKTVGLGQIASSGLLIFMTGAPGRRILTPNTSILSHQFSWYNEGKAHELFATMREYELTQTRMIEHYRRCTGQEDQVIKEYLLPAQDRWLSGEEALRLNVCDQISSHTLPPQPVVEPLSQQKKSNEPVNRKNKK